MNKDLNYYLSLPWTYRFQWDERDNLYIVSVAELNGCQSSGKTIVEASEMIQDALECFLEMLLEHNDPIPEPAKPSDFKGVITYRTTPEKHFKLQQKALIEGKSINKIIDEAIEKDIA